MQSGPGFCLIRLSKSFDIYVSVCVFVSPVRLQTKRGCKCGPFRGGGLQPDPAALPQREVVPALLSREGQGQEGGHLLPSDFWGRPHRSVPSTNLWGGCDLPFTCVCSVTDRCVSARLKARYGLSGLAVYSAGRCLSCCHRLRIKTQFARV